MTKRPGQIITFYVDDTVFGGTVALFNVDHAPVTLGAGQRIWLDTLSCVEAPNASDGPAFGPFQGEYALTRSSTPSVNYFTFCGAVIAANGYWADPTNIHLRFPEPGYPLVAGDVPHIVLQSSSDANWYVYGLARIRPATDGA